MFGSCYFRVQIWAVGFVFTKSLTFLLNEFSAWRMVRFGKKQERWIQGKYLHMESTKVF